jgi:hypothetical protein
MEMLVVISIIVLLISIMLPSLSKSKENARRALCMANLHGQVQAGTSYSVNNKDFFPPSMDANGQRWAYSFDLRDSVSPAPKVPRGVGVLIKERFLDNQSGALHCPSMDTSASVYGTNFHSMDVTYSNWWNSVGASQWANPAYDSFRITIAYSYRGPSWFLTNSTNRFIRIGGMPPKFVVNVDIMDPRFGMLYTHREGYNFTRLDESTSWRPDPQKTFETIALPGGTVVDGVNRPTIDEILFKKLEDGN